MLNFIHIGLNKTGTTFLQNGLFANHKELQVFGSSEYPGADNSQLFPIVSYVNNCSSLYFDDDYFVNYINLMLEKEEGGASIIGISSEGLSGGWRDGKSVKFIAEKLLEHFGKIKVILCLREQFSMLDSNYNQFLKRGGTVSFEECFFSPIHGGGMLGPNSVYETNVLSYFRYSHIVGIYMKLFGRENLKVCFYEDLKNDPEGFQKDICGFLGVSEKLPEANSKIERNTRLTACSLNILRVTNRLFNTKFNRKNGRLSFVGGYFYRRFAQQYNFNASLQSNPYLLYLEVHKRLQKKLAKWVQFRLDPLIRNFCRRTMDDLSALPAEKRKFLEEYYRQDNDRLCKMLKIKPEQLEAKGYIVS